MVNGFNKIQLIDPNDIDGQNSSTNIFKENEDLNIYVQLEVNKKSRTVINAGNGVSSTNSVNIKFIEGSKVEKALTTNYTLLTTSFDNDRETNYNDENLGITDITIEFDTAYHH
jgi:hypothetical protein